MKLKKGEHVVIPGCGVGRVEAKETMELGESQVETWRIYLGPDAGRYWVPVDRIQHEGLRPLMEPDRVKSTWKLIEEQEAPKKRAHWNQRRKRYQEMVMSNSPMELAKLIGELVAVRAKKKEKRQVLSFGERRLLEQAKELIVQEIAAATGKSETKIEERLDTVIASAA